MAAENNKADTAVSVESETTAKELQLKTKLQEIIGKAGKILTIDPNAKYMIVFKQGVLGQRDADLFQQLWRALIGVPMITVMCNDPQKDIKALEFKNEFLEKDALVTEVTEQVVARINQMARLSNLGADQTR